MRKDESEEAALEMSPPQNSKVNLLTLPIQAREVVGPSAGYRHRWAVNIESWHPEGEVAGSEFQFLLHLIQDLFFFPYSLCFTAFVKKMFGQKCKNCGRTACRLLNDMWFSKSSQSFS